MGASGTIASSRAAVVVLCMMTYMLVFVVVPCMMTYMLVFFVVPCIIPPPTTPLLLLWELTRKEVGRRGGGEKGEGVGEEDTPLDEGGGEKLHVFILF